MKKIYALFMSLCMVVCATASEEPEYALEETVEIANLTTETLTVEDATYLKLTGRNDELDSDIVLFLNDYTGEDKEYEVNVENCYMTFGGLELTITEGKLAQTQDEEKGTVYEGRVIATVEDEGEVLLVALDLVMYSSAESSYEVYEEKITNLSVDLDNMLLIGGPGEDFQVEVVLGLAEDNLDGTWSLSSESSISVYGSEATFIDGYAYEIDIYAPEAKAVVHCEWKGMALEFRLTMSAAPMEATEVVVENAIVEVDKHHLFGDTYDYSLKMTGTWTDEEGVDYPVLVEIPVYYPEATEPSTILSTVTVGGSGDDDPWLGFGEGDLTITTVDKIVTATGVVENPQAGVAIDITISGDLKANPETGLENVQVNVKAAKMIKNGQLIILNNNGEYNAQGATLK